MTSDADGHREYTLRALVQCTSANDGPATVSVASGLPTCGATWAFGGEVDVYAWRRPDVKVTPKLDDEKNLIWIVELKYSTRPLENCRASCSIEDPLAEPPKINGTFQKY